MVEGGGPSAAQGLLIVRAMNLLTGLPPPVMAPWVDPLTESHFLGRLIRSLGVPKEREVWDIQGGRKDKLFLLFFLYIP